MRLAPAFACLPLLAQSYLPQPVPAIYAVVAGAQNAPAPVSLYFNCINLASIPALAGTNCTWQIGIPAGTPPGLTMYMGLNQSLMLHVSALFPVVGCLPPASAQTGGCVQDIYATPQPGEWPIGVYQVESGVRPTWTGSPAQPTVSVTCPAGYGSAVVQSPGTVSVSCQ